MYQYAYLVGLGLFSTIWIAIFVLGKSTRRQMLIMSFLIGFFGPLSEFFYKDYWRPNYIFSMTIGGGDSGLNHTFLVS